MTNVPLWCFAKSQLKIAVRAPPTWRWPVGDGAKRTRTVMRRGVYRERGARPEPFGSTRAGFRDGPREVDHPAKLMSGRVNRLTRRSGEELKPPRSPQSPRLRVSASPRDLPSWMLLTSYLDGHDRHRADAFAAADEAEVIGRRRLHVDVAA